ncbi:MAG TPA: galactose-1-epimerase [Clostridiales bacterium]|nr:galactose-1-epimerase [Clostridiales bacterium]
MEQKHVGDGLFEFTYKNAVGAGIKLTNLGCAIMELHMPDSQGNMADVVLGYDTASGYEDNSPSIGVTIGRYANRVTCHPYEINGQTYYPVCDTGKPYVIHGDPLRFSRRAWDAEAREHSVLFKLRSEEGESGFPGNVDVGVEIALSDQNILRITYSAQTDKDTPLNLTNHSYFNLRGEGSIEEYIAQIDADHFTAYDQNLVPTGEVASVFGTPFDFNSPRAIGERIDESHPMLKAGGGYDLNYIIRGIGMRRAARVHDPKTGRFMETWTDMPGVQFYTSNNLGATKGKNGAQYGRRSAFCLETQFFPDSIHFPHFPNSILKAGDQYTSVTEYRFGVQV